MLLLLLQKHLQSAIYATGPASGAYFAFCILIPKGAGAIQAARLSSMTRHSTCVHSVLSAYAGLANDTTMHLSWSELVPRHVKNLLSTAPADRL